MKKALAAWILATAPVQAAHQDWKVRHQPDRFMDRVMMEAFADSDSGPGRLTLYCDTESGFRVMFMPHRALLPEGPARLTLRIDGGKPLVMAGDAFGDDTTDVVTVHDTGRIERALSTARHVSAHFEGLGPSSGDDAFTFGDLAAGRAMLMKVCPISE
jgi:hypothetical protein